MTRAGEMPRRNAVEYLPQKEHIGTLDRYLGVARVKCAATQQDIAETNQLNIPAACVIPASELFTLALPLKYAGLSVSARSKSLMASSYRFKSLKTVPRLFDVSAIAG